MTTSDISNLLCVVLQYEYSLILTVPYLGAGIVQRSSLSAGTFLFALMKTVLANQNREEIERGDSKAKVDCITISSYVYSYIYLVWECNELNTHPDQVIPRSKGCIQWKTHSLNP